MFFGKRDREKVNAAPVFVRVSGSMTHDNARTNALNADVGRRVGSSGVSKFHKTPVFLLRQCLALLLVAVLMAVFYFMHVFDPLERRT